MGTSNHERRVEELNTLATTLPEEVYENKAAATFVGRALALGERYVYNMDRMTSRERDLKTRAELLDQREEYASKAHSHLVQRISNQRKELAALQRKLNELKAGKEDTASSSPQSQVGGGRVSWPSDAEPDSV